MSQDLQPPYYAAIFSSRRTPGDSGYGEAASRMEELARGMPGYLGIESVRDPETGQGITVSYWRDAESILSWKAQAEHRDAQRLGRAKWYSAYEVRICRVERSYSWQEETPAGSGKTGSSGLVIRTAAPADSFEIARLSEQLGYPSTPSQIETRLGELRKSPGKNEVLVATLADGTLAGWIHILVFRSLATDPRIEVAALVVDEKHRGHGIGKRLMAEAEDWARERGFDLIRLSSQTKRQDAHRFYEKLGYEIRKTSHVLMKNLGKDR